MLVSKALRGSLIVSLTKSLTPWSYVQPGNKMETSKTLAFNCNYGISMLLSEKLNEMYYLATIVYRVF